MPTIAHYADASYVGPTREVSLSFEVTPKKVNVLVTRA